MLLAFVLINVKTLLGSEACKVQQIQISLLFHSGFPSAFPPLLTIMTEDIISTFPAHPGYSNIASFGEHKSHDDNAQLVTIIYINKNIHCKLVSIATEINMVQFWTSGI